MKKLIFPVTILVAASSASAQTAFTGTYTWGANGNVTSFDYNGTDVANLTESAFTKVGVTSTSSSPNFRATGWALDPVVGSLAGTIDTAKYFQFSLTADSGYELDMTSLTFGIGRSGQGPRSFAWSSSVDNHASLIADYTIPSGISASVSHSSGVVTLADVTSTTLTGITLNLSAAAFQDLSDITLRFYAYNAEATGGTAGLQGPLTFSGSLLNTAPATGGPYWAGDVGGGGNGTWSVAGTNWATGLEGSGRGQTQGSAELVFADAAGTVEVSGGVTVANGMTFRTTGYTVQGGLVTLSGASSANNAITVDNAVITTLASQLDGAAGLTKSGSGTLVLSGTNTLVGNIVISGGTLQVSADTALGDAANDLVNNGALRTLANLALGSGRDLSGSGSYDIASGTTLTVNGIFNATATTLANTGILSLQGATTRSVGSLTFAAAGTLNAVGAISATGLTASAVTSGTAEVNADITFTSGDKSVAVGTGGTLELNGILANGATSGRILKVGSGTLVLSGANAMGGLRIGAAGVTPNDGGTVVIGNASVGSQAQAIQLNYGTLSAATNLTLATGVSVGGRVGAVARLTGSDLEFTGALSFFRATGTTGELVLNVDNTTTLTGGLGATSGGGTATGVTLGGSGELVLAGTSSAFVDTLTLTDTLQLTLDSALGGGLVVGSGNTLAGGGTLSGSLTFNAGSKFLLSLVNPLTVNGASVSFANFGIDDLIGLSSSTPLGTYTLIDGLATVNTANLINLGAANAFDLGGGKSAYFTQGSLILNVVPEPSTYGLALGALALVGAALRRRRRLGLGGTSIQLN